MENREAEDVTAADWFPFFWNEMIQEPNVTVSTYFVILVIIVTHADFSYL